MNKIEKGFKETGGCAIDLNFNPVSRDELNQLILNLFRFFNINKAYDSKGNDLISILKSNQLDDFSGSISSFWENGKGLFNNIQASLYLDKRNGDDVELTLFPEDIQGSFTDHDFLSFLKVLFQGIQISEYYIRYENYDWDFGDTSENSAVFYSHHDAEML